MNRCVVGLVGLLVACGGNESAPPEEPAPQASESPAAAAEAPTDDPDESPPEDSVPPTGRQPVDANYQTALLDALGRATEVPESCLEVVETDFASFFNELRTDATESSVRCSASTGGSCLAELQNNSDVESEFAAFIEFMIVGGSQEEPAVHIINCQFAG